MKSIKRPVPLGLLLGALLVVALTALALGLLMSGSWFYEIEMGPLAIGEYTGLSDEVILRNYRVVIDFLSPFGGGSFSMPDLAFSAAGAQHFSECRDIMLGVYAAGALSLVIIVILALAIRKRRRSALLLSASVTTLALPGILLCCIAADFDRFFVLFHQVFFNNEYWIFDWRTDPVILLLPEEYFMHCAIFIAAFWVLGALGLLLMWRRRRGLEALGPDA